MIVKREGLWRRPAFWFSAAIRDTLPKGSSSDGQGFGMTDLDVLLYRRRYGRIEDRMLNEVKCGYSYPSKMQSKVLDELSKQYGGLNLIRVITKDRTEELRRAHDDLARAQMRVVLLEDGLPRDFMVNEEPISGEDLVTRLSMGLQPQQKDFKLAEETKESIRERLGESSEKEELEEMVEKLKSGAP